MIGTFSSKPSKVTMYKLSNEAFQSIGRLVRACAEIEDIVTMFMCSVAGLSEAQATVLLGKTAISQKLRITKTFADALGQGASEAYNVCFENDEFRSIIQCRNTVAHGFLLGMTDEGKVAFRVSEIVGVDGTAASILVHSYFEKDIGTFANMAEGAIPQIEKLLRLRSLREKRRSRPLDPHRKAQQTRQPSEPRVRQRRPSRKSPKL